MSWLRGDCNSEEAEAHKILDAVRLGIDVPSEKITRALWITGDAIGLIIQEDTAMKPLHISEARCAGRDTKQVSTICAKRNECARHRQLQIDRDMGISDNKNIKVYTLPFIKGLDCNYFLPVKE